MNGAYKLHPALMLDISPQASGEVLDQQVETLGQTADRKSTRLNSSHRL